MAEREENVYKAKLAEQAERYDGMLNSKIFYPSLNASNINYMRIVVSILNEILLK